MKKFIPAQIIGLIFTLTIFYLFRHVLRPHIYLENLHHLLPVAGMILLFAAFTSFFLGEGAKKNTTFFSAIAIGIYLTLLTIPLGYTLIAGISLIYQIIGDNPIQDIKTPAIILFTQGLLTYCGILWVYMNAEEYVSDNNLSQIGAYTLVFLKFIIALIAMIYIFREDIF